MDAVTIVTGGSDRRWAGRGRAAVLRLLMPIPDQDRDAIARRYLVVVIALGPGGRGLLQEKHNDVWKDVHR